MIAALDPVFALTPRVRPHPRIARFSFMAKTLAGSSEADTVSALSACQPAPNAAGCFLRLVPLTGRLRSALRRAIPVREP